MHKQLPAWQLIRKSLQEKIPVTLLYVLESRGSSPGRQGFCMAVNGNGGMEGSIGGGIMEHKLVEMAKERMKEQGARYKAQDGVLRKQIHDKAAATDQSGMICSGEQTILVYPLQQTDLLVADQIIASVEQYKNGTLVLSPSGISFLPAIPPTDYSFTFQTDNDWEYREKTGYKNQLFIVGGGHCALALSRLMREMDFYITLYEERQGLNTLEKNKYAHEIIYVDDYSGIGHLIPSGRNHYVVIMTFGYRTDDLALRSLLHRKFSYLGMLGSKTKMEKVFTAYRSEGVPEVALQGISSPAGLSINSHSPEEIAVSIAAEIIRVKNGG